MPTIGYVTKTQNGFTGKLRTLTIKADIQIRPYSKPDNDKAPDYIVTADDSSIGTARKRQSKAGREYIALAFQDPFLPNGTIFANLVQAPDQDDEDVFSIVWDNR